MWSDFLSDDTERSRTHGSWSLVVAVLLLHAAPAPAASFRGIGDLPGGRFYSAAHGVSADGSVVVGISESSSGPRAVRWSAGELKGLPGALAESNATAIAADGETVVGAAVVERGQAVRPVVWRAGGAVVLDTAGWAVSTSGNGAEVVGVLSNGPYQEDGFRWRSDSDSVSLIPIAAPVVRPASIAADASVVVGTAYSSDSGTAFADENGVVTWLGDLPGGGYQSVANDVSSDGSVIVGAGQTDQGWQAFRWEAGVMTALGDLPDGGLESNALAVSGDGQTVLGVAGWTSGSVVWLWTAASGMRSLRAVLGDQGVDLESWVLRFASDISHDGRTIVGGGIDPAGRPQGWVATVPEPSGSAAGLGALAMLAFLTWRRQRSGPSCASVCR